MNLWFSHFDTCLQAAFPWMSLSSSPCLRLARLMIINRWVLQYRIEFRFCYILALLCYVLTLLLSKFYNHRSVGPTIQKFIQILLCFNTVLFWHCCCQNSKIINRCVLQYKIDFRWLPTFVITCFDTVPKNLK